MKTQIEKICNKHIRYLIKSIPTPWKDWVQFYHESHEFYVWTYLSKSIHEFFKQSNELIACKALPNGNALQAR